MRVLVLLGGEEDRDVDDRDDVVVVVKDADWASKVSSDGTAFLVWVHSQVAWQSAGAEERHHRLGLVPAQCTVRAAKADAQKCLETIINKMYKVRMHDDGMR